MLLKLAVLSAFFLQMGVGTLSPALASIAAAFPNIPFTNILLVSTLPVLTSLPATIISGRLAGRIIKYKTLIIIGTVLFIAGGIAPYFTQSFNVILGFRAIVGIGYGIVMPLGAALVIALFDGEEQAKMMGMGNVISNMGGILFQIMGGIAASFMWRYAFLVHGIAIIILLLVLSLPEPPKTLPRRANTAVPKLPAAVWRFASAIFIIMMLLYPLLMRMSTVIEVGNMGNAATAALVLTMFTVGGMISGFIFSRIIRVFKRNTVTFGLILLAVAMLCIAYGNNILFMYVAATLAGIGLCIISPYISLEIGKAVHPSLIPTATGIVLALMNVGGFMSQYFFDAVAGLFDCSGQLKFPFFFAMVVYVVLTVGHLLIKSQKGKMDQNDESLIDKVEI